MTHRQPSRSGCALPPKCAKNENKISNKKIKTQNKMMQRLSLLYSPETVVGGFIASCLAAQPRSSWSTRTIARLRHPRPTLSFISSSLPLPCACCVAMPTAMVQHQPEHLAPRIDSLHLAVQIAMAQGPVLLETEKLGPVQVPRPDRPL